MARWMNKLATFMAFAGCAAIAESAAAQGATAPDWASATKNERGQACEKYAERQEGSKLLVACGAAGVWEFNLGEPTLRFVRSYDLGVNAYVVKPVDFHAFVSAITEVGLFWAILNQPPPPARSGR